MQADPAAAEKVFAGWPTPIVTVGREIGEALPFPGESIAKDFAYSGAHPIADAYRAYQPMPYDAPSWAMAAMLYAAHPNDGYFKPSGSGVEMASAKPVPRKPRRPPDDKKDEKKQDPAK